MVSILTLVFRAAQEKILSNLVASLAWLIFGASTGFISFAKGEDLLIAIGITAGIFVVALVLIGMAYFFGKNKRVSKV